MLSIRARLINFMLRNRHLFSSEKRKPFDFNTSIQKFREDCEKGAKRLAKLPEGTKVEAFRINKIQAEFIYPFQKYSSKVILYIHGGGYVSGSCEDHRALVARIVNQTGIKALQFNYRLAPENPFPAALEDSITAYQFLLNSGIPASDIIIAGESAGGGLCLCTLLAIRERNLPLPSSAVAISPWTDLKCTGESYKTKNKVSLAPLNSWTVFSKYYTGDNDPLCPFISPIYGDLSKLPPILLYAGEDDELIDDAVKFAEKASAAGTKVLLRTGKGMVHCYPLLPAFIPEAKAAMKEICEFIRNS